MGRPLQRGQRFLQAKAAPGLARPSWFVLADLLASLGEATSYFVPSDVFAALAALGHSSGSGLAYGVDLAVASLARETAA